jgi:hypothetical protein
VELNSRIVVLRDDYPVKGHIVIDPDGGGFTFAAETGLLPEGAYKIRLQSGGFSTPAGETLDGDFDGKAGGDYRGRFNIMSVTLEQSSKAAAVSDDFDWITERWGVQDDVLTDSEALWSALTGGFGGLAMLATKPDAKDTRMARRALAAGARKHDDELGDSVQDIRIASHGMQTVETVATRPMPGWVSGWLGPRKPANQDWRIRL